MDQLQCRQGVAFVLIGVCSRASVNGERSKLLSEGFASNATILARRAAAISATVCLGIGLITSMEKPRQF